MANGFERTMVLAGADDSAIVMRSGSTSEMSSGFSNEQALIVTNAPGVLKNGDTPIASAELYVVVDVKKKSNNSDANVPFRGIQASAFDVRKDTRIAEGRMFETGKTRYWSVAQRNPSSRVWMWVRLYASGGRSGP